MKDWIPAQASATNAFWMALGWLSTHGSRILLTLILCWIALRAARALGQRIVLRADDHDPSFDTEAERRARTLAQVLDYVARGFVFVTGGLVILNEFGTDIRPLLAGAGIAGVALGFGAQSLVKDFLGGVFILTENQFRVGDAVELAGKSGIVEAINLRSTVLRAVDGAVHIVPNGQIGVATNMSYRWSRAVIDLSISFDSDLDRVEEVLRVVGKELKADPTWGPDLLEEPQIAGLESIGESSVSIRMSVKTQPLRQWDVARQLRRRVKRAFDEARIEIPFPQRVIHHRQQGPNGGPQIPTGK